MKLAYVDTSCLLAIALGEPGGDEIAGRLTSFDRLVSSNLLEAELRAALARERVSTDAAPLLSWLGWIHPNRPLTPEFGRVLAFGLLKGADLWHLACALFLTPDAAGASFLTLDNRQGKIAAKLGFASCWRGPLGVAIDSTRR